MSYYLDAGYDAAQKVSRATAKVLYNDLARVNARQKYFKGTIGLRDVRRLSQAASYIE